MFTIVKATTSHCTLIHDMAQVVFRDTYREIISSEQMEYMIDWMYSLDNLHKQMTEDGHVYFIGYWDNKPCGYISIEQQGDDLFHLQKIYAMPSFQGKGIGKKLFSSAIDYIKSIHPTTCSMKLNVNRNNKAVEFYKHMGMIQLRQGDFEIGNGYYMNDYIMGIEI